MWTKELVDALRPTPTTVQCGRVIAGADGILTVVGLPDCRYYELLEVGRGRYAIAMNLLTDCVKAMLITGKDGVEYGALVKGTGKIVEVPVGKGLLGRVVNPLGKPIDGDEGLFFDKVRPIESPAPKIIDREKVSRPLMTGILAIDSMVPIGKGQRELIIGDRQTGKTSIAVDAIINQRDKDVVCIYVAIGQRAGSVTKLISKLKSSDAMKNTVLVVSTADDNAALQYIAPYTGCAMAEEFMEQGKDVLIVYDDLTKHANAYRTISLLLKRPSGREAYPGDVFYIHSRLLERSAQLSAKKGGGSITALPIIETQAGDISQYIPTNVISITDGQIYLESELFHSGVRPAVNVGLSVSRVGGSAQYPAIRKLSSKLRLDLAHFRELALFTQFGSEVDDDTKRILEQGEKVTTILTQKEGEPFGVDKEAIYLYMIGGKLSDVDKSEVKKYIEGFYSYFCSIDYASIRELKKTGVMTDEIRSALDDAARDYATAYAKKK
ncbi:MAG: F0F1 ATP synthase subunit alpha [Clostridia bacterium]|nr:F0F1 ATP synthase subunit alpha [Clostridia bacterium]